MPKLTYRVLYNQDCTNLFAVTREPLEARHVEQMVDEVAGAGADVMLVNPNAQRVNYPSKVWQTFWDGFAPDSRAFFGPVPDADVPGRRHWVSQMKRLADQGCDYLACALARCRKRGIAPGVTIRMNDVHDVPWPGSNLFSRFYMAHPELRLSNPPICNWAGAGLNYEHPAVREHYLGLIGEIVTGYDLEVLELDFLRFPCYFPRSEFERHCEIMTDFIREVRRLIDGSGKRIALIPRVAAVPAAARELGFDVGAWAGEGLVDGVTFGAFFTTAWTMPVDEYRRLVGDGVALYASTDYAADRRRHLPARNLPLDEQMLRGFAAGHLAAGADGVCLFNFFCAREGPQPTDPLFAAIRDLGSLEGLRQKPRLHTVTGLASQPEADGPVQTPVELASGRVQEFRILLAAGGSQVHVEVPFAGGPAEAEQLWMCLNAAPLGCAKQIRPIPDAEQPAWAALFTAPPDAPVDGRNTILLRNEGAAITVLGLDVRVNP